MTSRTANSVVLSLLTVLVFGGAEGSARAQSAPRYMTSSEDVEELNVVNLRERLSVGLQVYSVVPASRPYQAASSSGTTAFRYQASGAFGLELGYKLRTGFDLGLSAAYELYESRIQQAGTQTEFNIARMKLFPVVATARWQWPRQFWSPELEAGVGMGIFNMSLTSTNLAHAEVPDSSTSLLAHAAGGMSVAWLDDTNLGILLGYRQMFLGAKAFPISNDVTINRSSLSGFFAKATLRHQF